MELLKLIRVIYQEAIDEYFGEALKTRDYKYINGLLRDFHPMIPSVAVNLQRLLYLALFVENYVAAQDIVAGYLGKKLEGTVDYEDEDNAGWSPLHQLVEDDNYDGAKFLLENGADPDVKAEDGTQPIDLSVELQNVRMTKLLMSYGADSCGNIEAFKKAIAEDKFPRLKSE